MFLMAYRQVPFAPDEWYHCFTRSIDRKRVFTSANDYNRFLQALYLCNSATAIERGAIYRPSHTTFFTLERGEPLVAVGAYCLMPNHFHLLLRQVANNGISTFMQKVGTSFSMYYNVKHKHIGNVFIKPFRAKHVDRDEYFQKAVQYIHLNPAELFEPGWKEGKVKNAHALQQKLCEYRYSSLMDYLDEKRPENNIIDFTTAEYFTAAVSIEKMVSEAADYYTEIRPNFKNL
jgi:putative transposase